MTETDWLTWTDPRTMLEFVRGQVSDRGLRLFGVACCRRFWKRFPRPLRECVELAEQYADGLAAQAALWDAWSRYLAFRDARSHDQQAAVGHLLWGRENDWPEPEGSVGYVAFWLQKLGDSSEAARQADLLRDVVGNPFRPQEQVSSPVTIPSRILDQFRWMYEQRAFLALPVWADALEEAGYPVESVLTHLRSGSAHTRGCWAVDLVLNEDPEGQPRRSGRRATR